MSMLACATLSDAMMWLVVHASSVLPIICTHAKVLHLYSHYQPCTKALMSDVRNIDYLETTLQSSLATYVLQQQWQKNVYA